VQHSRRDFLKRTGLAASVASLASARASTRPNPVGYAMISWPDEQFNDALPIVSSLHYRGVQFRADVYRAYASKPAELKDRLKSLHLTPVALSFPTVSVDPAKRAETTALFREYAKFLHHVGGLYLQLIDGGDPDATYSNSEIQSYGQHLNELGKIAHESGVTFTYHPHLSSIGETREGMGRILAATDARYLKLEPDTAHMSLGGMDVPDAIRTYRDRLAFLHFKDAVKEVADQARANRAPIRKAKVRFCELGRGAVNFPAVLKALDDVHFTGWIIVELDAYEAPPGGPAEAARTNRDEMRKMGFRV
jgi:inosose dehydratase